MAGDEMDIYVARLHRKCALDEEEREKQMKIIVGTITIVIAAFVARYHGKFVTEEPLPDWDHERRTLNGLYNGSEVDCVEQLRVSKHGFLKLCKILHENNEACPYQRSSGNLFTYSWSWLEV
ncbi:hypothetical protein L1049_008260 [Liquidambar formosana]|uniref:Uncharacterized protein n=1 Tax=Liquidambar formosana TaxID=63359 RepID=A0AAP0X4G2_LIQFO